MKNKPLISIIISTLNNEVGLKATLDSLRAEKYSPIEIIVIDGGSQDSTLDVICSNRDLIAYYVSENDFGVYDAWNKGLDCANGQYISFLGGGDKYVNGGLEKLVNDVVNDPSCDFLCSKVNIVRNGKCIKVVGAAWDWETFRRYMNTAHVGALHAKRLFNSNNRFDKSYKIAGDYEFLLRFRGQLKTRFINDVTVEMTADGLSFGNSKVIHESTRAKIKHHTMPKWILFLNHYWTLIKFLLKKLFF